MERAKVTPGSTPTPMRRSQGRLGQGSGRAWNWEGSQVLISDWTRPSNLQVSPNSLNVLIAGHAIHLRCHRARS